MEPYHKIHNVYSRDDKTKRVSIGAWSLPEFAYLQDAQWVFTEKVDGTNVRVMWDGESVRFGGKTDNASMPIPLLDRLHVLFPATAFADYYDDGSPAPAMCLYGEGYGGKIQAGGKYNPEPDFVLFDVKVGQWWLSRENVDGVATNLAIRSVPVVRVGTLHDGMALIREGLYSTWGPFFAEGVVGKPQVELLTRAGSRIAVKIKHRDFQ
jgi:hypothetical protein